MGSVAQRKNDAGQVTILVLGLAMVAFAATGLAVDGTRAFILRRSLQGTADSAATAAAATLDRNSLYEDGLSIDARSAESVARGMLQRRSLPDSTTVRLRVSATEVELTLRSEMPTSFLGLVGFDRVAVAVVAEAAPFASD